MDYDTLYNTIPRFATAFVNMFSFNNNSYVIASKNAAAANTANQCTTFLPSDPAFVLKNPKIDNAFFAAIAQKYLDQPEISPKLPIKEVSQNFELANKVATTTDKEAESLLNSLIFTDLFDPQYLLNLGTFQPWMQGANNVNGSIVKLFMMMIVDSAANKWNGSYYAAQLLKYTISGINGLAICVDAVKNIKTSASVTEQTTRVNNVVTVPTDPENNAKNATTIYNVLVQSASQLTNNVECANIQTMMGPDTLSQLKQLDLMLGQITLPVLNKYSYFFLLGGYSIAELLGNLTPLTLQSAGLSSVTSGQQAWPTLLSKVPAFLAGTVTDKTQVSPAIVLSYYRTITVCIKQTGVATSSNSSAIQFIFTPASIQTAYGLTNEELSTLALEQGFSFT
jgi:hypothetical protein